MKWGALLLAWLAAFNVFKIITAFRTGKIGMYTSSESGQGYSRSQEPWGFYRAIVLLALFTRVLVLLALFDFLEPGK
ncbi:hypothetical protein [Dyella sp. C11]|uniref:hypothetical protein n=1 Tax=Dyella sp. C11 TaxID=2126991 RepID=UPI000D65A968|nr:hypothetical protein [Dyella sp. C11]